MVFPRNCQPGEKKNVERPTNASKIIKECKRKTTFMKMKIPGNRKKKQHDQYLLKINNVDVDKRKTYKWLKIAGLMAERKAFIISE